MLELMPNQLGYPLLSLLIFVPVAGAVVLLAVRDAHVLRRAARPSSAQGQARSPSAS